MLHPPDQIRTTNAQNTGCFMNGTCTERNHGRCGGNNSTGGPATGCPSKVTCIICAIKPSGKKLEPHAGIARSTRGPKMKSMPASIHASPWMYGSNAFRYVTSLKRASSFSQCGSKRSPHAFCRALRARVLQLSWRNLYE